MADEPDELSAAIVADLIVRVAETVGWATEPTEAEVFPLLAETLRDHMTAEEIAAMDGLSNPPPPT